MTDIKKPEALRLADHLEHFRSFPDDLAAAAELRRLHAELEATDRQVNILTDTLHNANEDAKRFREAASCERETRRQLERHSELLEASLKEARTLMEGYAEVKVKDEALLRQALEALEYCRSGEDCHPTLTSEALDALRERLT